MTPVSPMQAGAVFLTPRFTRVSLYRRCAEIGLTQANAAWLAGVRSATVSRWAKLHKITFRRATVQVRG